MPIPDAERAIVTREKIEGYLLNQEHTDGGSKATWFRSLGYELDNWQILAADLLTIAKSCDRFDTERSPYGIKYKASGVLSRPDYRQGRVMTVWIVEFNDPPRLVTAYSDAS